MQIDIKTNSKVAAVLNHLKHLQGFHKIQILEVTGSTRLQLFSFQMNELLRLYSLTSSTVSKEKN